MKASDCRHVFVALAVLAGACTKELPVVDLKGDCADVNKGQVCTWAKTHGDTVLEVGVDVSLVSLENASADAPFVWPPVAAATLKLPEPVMRLTALQQFTMYWEAGGHPPGPYMTPHFDFHFNSVSAGDIAAIDCADLSKPTALPAAYALPDIPLPPPMAKMMGAPVLIGLCVPKMGMHSLLASEMESKTTFRGSMVVGFYHAKPIFVEPMLTRAMLLEKKSFDLAVPAVPGATGAYPHAFKATYEEAKQLYHFAFSNFSAGS